jgi:transposase
VTSYASNPLESVTTVPDTFVDVAGVEPTNDAGERALRRAAIRRKHSFGTQNASGRRFVETLPSVVETCRQSSRSVFAFVTRGVAADFAHHSAS